MHPTKSTKQFIDDAIEKHGNCYDYSQVSYVNNKMPVEIICKEHGSFTQRPTDHLAGSACPECCGNKKGSTETFIEKANKIHNNKYQYHNVDYVNSKTKVSITCPIHGDFNKSPAKHIIENQGCPKCSDNRHNRFDFIRLSREVHGSRYTYSRVSYKNNSTKVIITCREHGDFSQTAKHHLLGNGCPRCNASSTGEQMVAHFLETMSINYVQEYPVCKNPKTGRHLRADFFLPEFNVVIEYDGIQHFKEVSIFGGKGTLKKNQYRDSIKNKYCLDNNIPMLRIPYTQKHKIKKLLTEFLQTESIISKAA